MPISSQFLPLFNGIFTLNEEDLWRNILQEHPSYSHNKPETWPLVTFENVIAGCGENELHQMLPRYVVYDQIFIPQLLEDFPRPSTAKEYHYRWPFNFYLNGTSKPVAMMTDSEYRDFAEHTRQMQQPQPSASSAPHSTLVADEQLERNPHRMPYAPMRQLLPKPPQSAQQDTVMSMMPPPEAHDIPMPMAPQPAPDGMSTNKLRGHRLISVAQQASLPQASIGDANRPDTSNHDENEQAMQGVQQGEGKKGTRREPALLALGRAAGIIVGELKWFGEGLKFIDETKDRAAWMEAERTYGPEDLNMVERTAKKLGTLSAQLSRCVVGLQVGIARRKASGAYQPMN